MGEYINKFMSIIGETLNEKSCKQNNIKTHVEIIWTVQTSKVNCLIL